MKKFQFELEEILTFRLFEQKQAEIELGKALAVEKAIQDKLDLLALQQISVQKNMNGSKVFEDIANANRFYEFVRTKSEELLNQLTQAKLVSEQKRDILKNAMQNTDALKKIKEKQKEEYKLDLIREEDNELDDIVTSRTKK